MKVFLAVLTAIVALGAVTAGLAVNMLVDDSSKPGTTAAAEAPKPGRTEAAKPRRAAKPIAPSPALRVVSRWVKAMANHQWAAACSLETPTYRGANCPGVYTQSFAESEYATGLDIVKGLHVVARTKERPAFEEFRAAGPNLDGAVLITVARQENGRWLVADTEPGQ